MEAVLGGGPTGGGRLGGSVTALNEVSPIDGDIGAEGGARAGGGAMPSSLAATAGDPVGVDALKCVMEMPVRAGVVGSAWGRLATLLMLSSGPGSWLASLETE